MYPSWIIKKIPKSSNIKKIRELINDDTIHTVCESAKCPNIGECFSKKTVTFMILGDVCTRNCGFCAVKKGSPLSVNENEPKTIAKSVKKLKAKYAVITSVTRDDLPDGGAGVFFQTIKEIGKINEDAKIEVLIPDFLGKKENISKVLDAQPYVLNHNLETVPRLYKKIRPNSDYERSLYVLKFAKTTKNSLYTKSGIMVGLGERKDEVLSLMEDLRKVECDVFTIGQYLQPSKNQVKVEEFIKPELFEEYRSIGEKLGFKRVFSGPFVRSSYKASEIDD